MISKHIEVITINTTGMKETAFGTVETSYRFYQILKQHYKNVSFNVVKSVQDLNKIAAKKPNLAVLCVKYILDDVTGEEIWLSDFFAECDIAYTGSDRETLSLDSDKAKAKRIIIEAGLSTAKFFIADPNTFQCEAQLPLAFPLFVKPMDAANGNGIDENSLVHNFASYKSKINEVFLTYGEPALVEEYLSGREFTVAVLDDLMHNHRLISPVEIIVPINTKGDRVLGCFEKSKNNEKLGMVLEPELSMISSFVDKVFTALGVQDFGRIDIKMDENNIPHFMEANLVPGMTPGTSYFPRACFHNYGMSHNQVVLRMTELALLRAENPANIPPTELLPFDKIAS